MTRIITGLCTVLYFILSIHSVARANLVIGTFDTTRSTTANILTGNYSQDAVASIYANFPGSSFVTAPTLTPDFLAGVDILFITSDKTADSEITPLSVSEQTAMVNFVKAGGSALLLAEGASTFLDAAETMVGPFGVTVEDDDLTGILLANMTDYTSPVVNGPYGVTDQMLLYGAGNFTDLGPYAQSLAVMYENNLSVFAAIPSHAMGPNSGRVVMMSDTSPFIDDGAGGVFSVFEPLFLNTMTYLATPEPSSFALVAIAGSTLTIAAAARSYKRKQR